MKLSEHFTLEECMYSETAEKHDIENYPNDEQIANIKALLENVIEPVRNHFNCAIYVNSCFRSHELEIAVSGKAYGQHMANNGAAAMDFHVKAVLMKDIYKWIKENLDFDQLIDEKNLSWIHVSFKNKGKNRKMAFKL